MPDAEYSRAERRRLAKAPELSVKAVLSGDYAEDAEEYLLDQFPFRDGFRALKAGLRLKVFRQLDNNGLFVIDDGIYKLDAPLKEEQVLYAANKINGISREHLAGLNVYYSIIPDKNRFVAAQHGYPAMEAERIAKLMHQSVTEAEYIDIFPALSIGDYYRTDSHWRQERILPVADLLLSGMGNDYRASKEDFSQSTLSPFYGVYSGQLALPVSPDRLTYLESPATAAATAEIYGADGAKPVYFPEEFDGMDGYDVYLSGAEPLISIHNPGAREQRGLVIFRDSFGSSLAPLLLGGYSDITLVDLRYFSSDLLADYVDFSGKDVLFIYSTSLLASGMLLK